MMYLDMLLLYSQFQDPLNQTSFNGVYSINISFSGRYLMKVPISSQWETLSSTNLEQRTTSIFKQRVEGTDQKVVFVLWNFIATSKQLHCEGCSSFGAIKEHSLLPVGYLGGTRAWESSDLHIKVLQRHPPEETSPTSCRGVLDQFSIHRSLTGRHHL